MKTANLATRRLSLQFDDFDSLLQEVHQLQQVGYDRAGNWDLAQICDHLASTMNWSIDGFPFTLPWLLRAIAGPPAKWVILRRRYIPAGVTLKTIPMPSASTDLHTAVRHLHDAVDRVQGKAAGFAKHPLLGPLGPEEWGLWHRVHAEHHLSFLVPRIDDRNISLSGSRRPS